MRDKGFWDGGSPGQSSDDQHAGRTSGVPRTRQGKRTGVRTDIEFPKKEK